MTESLDAGAPSPPATGGSQTGAASDVPNSAAANVASAMPPVAKTVGKSSAAQPVASSSRAKAVLPAFSPINFADRRGPQTWEERLQLLRHDAPGYGISILVHTLIFLVLSFFVMPQELREDLLNTLIASNAPIGDGDGSGELDSGTLVPELLSDPKGTTTVQVDSAIVADQPVLADLDISDGMPQLDLNGTAEAGVGNAVAKGDLSGRGKKARGALLASQGGTAGSEAAVSSGLKWLARHQKRDGSWSFEHGPDDPGTISNPTGATGLALLAFLGGGHTHVSGDYQQEVDRGIKFLLSKLKVTPAGGDLRSDNDPQGMYAHGICAIALCEAYALSQDRNLKLPTQQAITFIVNAQDSKGGGWRYVPNQKGDTSVVGWQVMALKSAKIAKLQIPQKTISKSTAFLNSVQSERGAKYGYQEPGAGIGTTSVGLLCRMYLGWTPKHVALVNGVKFLGDTGPQPQNIYFDYYATQVLHHWGGEPWTKWNSVMREYLVSTQEKQGDAAGSWKPVGTEHAEITGGRLYRTCMSIMTLEVYYRHLPLYQRETLKVDL